jgi:hypothetical protein
LQQGPNQHRPFAQPRPPNPNQFQFPNPNQQLTQSQAARKPMQSLMTTQFPQPKYDQPKPHSLNPTSMQANQAQQAKQFAQPNQSSQANPLQVSLKLIEMQCKQCLMTIRESKENSN